MLLLKRSEDDLTGHAAEFLRLCFDELSAAPEEHFEKLAAGAMNRLSRHPGYLRYLAPQRPSDRTRTHGLWESRFMELLLSAASGGNAIALRRLADELSRTHKYDVSSELIFELKRKATELEASPMELDF